MYNIGFIGLGKISAKHMAAVKENDNFLQFTGGYDIDENTAKTFAAKNGGKIYSSCNELIAQNDVISVLTSHDSHAKIIKEVVKAGKICICEKPICLHYNELSYIKNNSIFCISQNRYNKAVLLLKEKIKDLGRINFIQANTFWHRNPEYYSLSSWRGDAKKEGGILYNQGYHIIDTILYLLNASNEECEVVFAKKENFEKAIKNTESYIKIILNIKNIMVDVLITTVFAKENFENSLVVSGCDGSIKISGNHLNEIAFPKEYFFTDDDKNIYGSSHIKNYQDIFAGIMGTENQAVHLEEALDRIKLIEKIYSTAGE